MSRCHGLHLQVAASRGHSVDRAAPPLDRTQGIWLLTAQAACLVIMLMICQGPSMPAPNQRLGEEVDTARAPVALVGQRALALAEFANTSILGSEETISRVGPPDFLLLFVGRELFAATVPLKL